MLSRHKLLAGCERARHHARDYSVFAFSYLYALRLDQLDMHIMPWLLSLKLDPAYFETDAPIVT
jgi:hypothetical protein